MAQKLTAIALERYFIFHFNKYELHFKEYFSFLQNVFVNLYLKTGLKAISSVFLITDAQILDEKFLMPINDFLACGEIPDLFSDDEITNIINNIRPEVSFSIYLGHIFLLLAD